MRLICNVLCVMLLALWSGKMFSVGCYRSSYRDLFFSSINDYNRKNIKMKMNFDIFCCVFSFTTWVILLLLLIIILCGNYSPQILGRLCLVYGGIHFVELILCKFIRKN